jgi:hypothetical protein
MIWLLSDNTDLLQTLKPVLVDLVGTEQSLDSIGVAKRRKVKRR